MRSGGCELKRHGVFASRAVMNVYKQTAVASACCGNVMSRHISIAYMHGDMYIQQLHAQTESSANMEWNDRSFVYIRV